MMRKPSQNFPIHNLRIVNIATIEFFYTLSQNLTTSQLTAACLDVDAASHADRTRNPRLLECFLKRNRPLTVCCATFVSSGGVEWNGIDVAKQAFEALCQSLRHF